MSEQFDSEAALRELDALEKKFPEFKKLVQMIRRGTELARKNDIEAAKKVFADCDSTIAKMLETMDEELQYNFGEFFEEIMEIGQRLGVIKEGGDDEAEA